MTTRTTTEKMLVTNTNEFDEVLSEIPMDRAIQDFYYHLKSHPRTILSAKFGDGKTYFLNKFERVAKEKNEVLFVTIHPVNYQVVDNKDVFELIKRDVLYQITVNGMLDENIEISELASWVFYIQNNFMGVTESFVSYLSLLQSPSCVVTSVLTALNGVKIFRDLRQRVKDIKNKYKTEDALEAFMNKCDDTSVLEEDIVTKIIQDSIDDYRAKHMGTRIVLVIEDMDRLDPAHLFRILNVFSAHLDTNENLFVKQQDFITSNKFHFDNVVFVMDYENTEKIFRHFYGIDADFHGYIEKFVTKGVFKYSIRDLAYEDFLVEKVSRIISLPKDYVRSVLQKECVKDKSLRAIAQSIDNIDSHIKKYPSYKGKPIDSRILRLYAIMNNLGVDMLKLKESFYSAIQNDNAVLTYYLGLFIGSEHAVFPKNKLKYILLKDKTSKNCSFFEIESFDEIGGCLKIKKVNNAPGTIRDNVIERHYLIWDTMFEDTNVFGIRISDLKSFQRIAFTDKELSIVLNEFVA